jgi:inner membrane protein
LDTGTHITMGIALGGLATLDPVAASHPATAQAIMVGAIAGSLAPDLDTILKLQNNATYIRNHRGITHSIPAVMLWPLLIILIVTFFFPTANLLHLWAWTFVAVILHVFVDIFNAYGTQALRPFTKKWIALGIINTFDPFIFLIHIAGIIVWGLGAHPGYTFLIVYAILVIYYIVRFRMQRNVAKAVRAKIPHVTSLIISPTLRFSHWHLAITAKNHFYVGRARCRFPNRILLTRQKKTTIYPLFSLFPPFTVGRLRNITIILKSDLSICVTEAKITTHSLPLFSSTMT